FLTGSRREIEADRVLATVMFTDIVESTKRAAQLGDRQWRTLVDDHDRMVREQLTRFRGCAIKTLGDGFLATFDGPARAVRCASSIVESVYSLGIDVRIGIHTGEVELKGDDIGGIADCRPRRRDSRAGLDSGVKHGQGSCCGIGIAI